MFHSATKELSNVPNLAATQRYFDLFKERDIEASFTDFLFDHDYVTLLDLRLRIGREIKHPHQAPAELEASGS
jgi:hypothetical protein